MLKSYWWGVCRRPCGDSQAAMWWVAHVILVSALGPNPSFFLFLGTFIQPGGLFGPGQGLGLGPGLDNYLRWSSLAANQSPHWWRTT